MWDCFFFIIIFVCLLYKTVFQNIPQKTPLNYILLHLTRKLHIVGLVISLCFLGNRNSVLSVFYVKQFQIYAFYVLFFIGIPIYVKGMHSHSNVFRIFFFIFLLGRRNPQSMLCTSVTACPIYNYHTGSSVIYKQCTN